MYEKAEIRGSNEEESQKVHLVVTMRSDSFHFKSVSLVLTDCNFLLCFDKLVTASRRHSLLFFCPRLMTRWSSMPTPWRLADTLKIWGATRDIIQN